MNSKDFFIHKANNFKERIEQFDVSHIGFWEMDSDSNVFTYNSKFYKQFNLDASGISLDDWVQLIHPDDRTKFVNELKEHKTFDAEFIVSDYRVLNIEGHYIWIEEQRKRDICFDGQILGTHRDITLLKENESDLYSEVYIDNISKLPNAKKLIKDLEDDFVDERSGTLVFIDLSHLNYMLTVYGQAFIDSLILEATKIINNIFASTFDIYRFIPFVFSFKANQSITENQLEMLCNQLESELSQLNIAFELSSEVIYKAVMMSFPQEESFPTCEDMFNRMFLTLEELKDRKGMLSVYTNSVEKRIHRKMFIETNLIKALEDQEIYPVYQPIVVSSEDGLLGFEALCRWNNPNWGPIYPDEFIVVAEKSGAIIRIGKFMIDKACSFIHTYNKLNKTDISVSINVSVVELSNPGYFAYLRSTVDKYHIKSSNLIIEITESLMLDDNTNVLKQLGKLKADGFGIAIDDFGTGYSSINTIFSTPITELKIDRGVMLKISSQTIVFDFIKSLVDLCHKNNILVVAEGIEDNEMMDISLKLNMDYLQGYKFSKPLILDKALEFIGH